MEMEMEKQMEMETEKQESRVKRDEWSEGGVTNLLEAYEAKWALRNRAKLKGHDWDDVARYVSAQASCTKTQTQCKNKIESMKKRYRSESATGGDMSTWPLYPRLDLLLRGNGQPKQQAVTPLNLMPQPVVVPPLSSQGSDGADIVTNTKEDKEGENMETTNDREGSPKTKTEMKIKMEKRKRRKKEGWEWERERERERERRESIRWVAQVLVRSERARMESLKEIEKMRIEWEAKRAQIDLKRTEIIANTHLHIAKIFMASTSTPAPTSVHKKHN